MYDLVKAVFSDCVRELFVSVGGGGGGVEERERVRGEGAVLIFLNINQQ